MRAMEKKFPDRYGLSADIREKFVPAIEEFIYENVDILLGNHVGNNDTVGKSFQITDSFNPFIDSSAWKAFLMDKIRLYKELIENEDNA